MIKRIIATEKALAVLSQLQARHGSLMIYQSGGCCEGSAPLCLPLGELYIGDKDICLGLLNQQIPFYIGKAQFEYWQYTQLILDVIDGNNGTFSLEQADNLCFVTRSRLFTDEELTQLEPLQTIIS